MGFLGLANAVFHPADYALLSAKVVPTRLGRAFSIHTFSGFLGNAVAPVTMLALVGVLGLRVGLIAAGVVALVAAVPLVLARGVENRGAAAACGRRRAAGPSGHYGDPDPDDPGLTGFFALMSLSGSGISNFSVVALDSAFDTSLSAANLALTAYLARRRSESWPAASSPT